MIDEHVILAALDASGCTGETAAVWVFGSEVSGRTRPDSDVDVAVLFTRKVTPSRRLALRDQLARQLRREIDLVDLGAASPILAMQVIRNGRLLVDLDASFRALFVASAPSRRYDVVRVRRAAEERMLERLADG